MKENTLTLYAELEKAAEAKPYMDAIKSRHNGYSGDPLFQVPKSPKAALDQLIGEAMALGLAESKAWQDELSDLREAVALYFKELERYKTVFRVQETCKAWHGSKLAFIDAEQQLRAMIGGDDEQV